MKIIEFHAIIMKRITKNIEFNQRITKIMKIMKFQVTIMKIMKILEFT